MLGSALRAPMHCHGDREWLLWCFGRSEVPLGAPDAIPRCTACRVRVRFGRIGVCTLLAAKCACMRACTPLCGLRAAVKASKPSHIETTFCDYDEIPTIG